MVAAGRLSQRRYGKKTFKWKSTPRTYYFCVKRLARAMAVPNAQAVLSEDCERSRRGNGGKEHLICIIRNSN